MSIASVIIPARNERYLQATIDNLINTAEGEIQVIPVIDGPSNFPIWQSNPKHNTVFPIINDIPQGMRPAINAGAQKSYGEYLMKCDAHCIFAPGWDTALKAACDDRCLVVPTRHSIDADTWTPKIRSFNYHYLTFPWDASMYGYGLHAKTLGWEENKKWNEKNETQKIQDLMTFQGSCWFMRRSDFFELLYPLDHHNYYFYQEAQEVGLKFWFSGGRCVINKNTWYAHLHKGSSTGRGFYLSLKRKRDSEAYSADYWLNNKWPMATRKFKWLIEHFWPLIGWPDDWENPKYQRDFFERTIIPAHI